MTSEEFEAILNNAMSVVIAQQQNIKEVATILVVCAGVIIGVMLASLLWRRF